MMMHLISLGRKKGSSRTRPGLDLAPKVPRWSFRSWTRSLSRTSGPTKCSRQVIKLWFPMVSSIFCDVFWWEEKQLWSSGRKHVPIFWRKKNAIESGGTWVFFRSRSFSWSFKASSLSAIWRRKVAWGVAVAIGRQGHSGQKSGELSWWLSHLATSSTHPPSDLFLQTLPGANPIKSQSSMAAHAPWTRSK